MSITVITAFEENGIIAYDCTHKDSNITSFSLVDVEPCVERLNNVSTISTRIQVLQARNHFDITVYQCKVVYKRTITHCGMHSHTSLYGNGYKYIMKDFSSDECIKLHDTRSLAVHNNIYISELKMNVTNHGQLYVSGSVDRANCVGSHYFDGDTTFYDAVVSVEYEITLSTSKAILDMRTQQLTMRNGLTCRYDENSCIDLNDGYYTWKHQTAANCALGKYTLLYEGPANKTYSEETTYSRQRVMYTALSNDQMFNIKAHEKIDLCGFEGHNTDHDNVFILEVYNIMSPIVTDNHHTKDLDIFTYFNSKITLVEHHIHSQLMSLYEHLIYEVCKVEKSLLETKLTLARKNPQEFALSLMGKPGYTSVITGEVIYVIECKPVYTVITPLNTCYQEIPVRINDGQFFISPGTRILQRHGTEIDCTPHIRSKFKFGGKWYNFDKDTIEVKSPHVLSPSVKRTWNYDPLPSQMRGGVYNPASIKKMHDMIYEHDDRRSATGLITRSMVGKESNHQDFDVANLIKESYIEGKIHKYWTKLLSWSTIFGQITSSMIGLWLICKMFKYIADSIVHGKILYDIYGFSWRLIAAFWDSLAVCMTHRYLFRRGDDTNDDAHVDPDGNVRLPDPRQGKPTNGLYPDLPISHPGSGAAVTQVQSGQSHIQRFDF